MTGQDYLEKMINSYRSAFDIIRPYDINGDIFDAYASFNVSSAKYVLVKKAELWRADCYEHTFFAQKQKLSVEDLNRFKKHVVSFIEPQLVRKGEKCTKKDHMYTYITGVYIIDQGISDEVKKAIKKFRFFKNYRWGLRGYSEVRILVFDMENKKIIGNPAARELVKGYKKAF
ncbi:MAG: hypothetical protein PHN80_09525 [Hespellia sp.]|nr:hypothetical protein [Hespellia sp.]